MRRRFNTDNTNALKKQKRRHAALEVDRRPGKVTEKGWTCKAQDRVEWRTSEETSTRHWVEIFEED